MLVATTIKSQVLFEAAENPVKTSSTTKGFNGTKWEFLLRIASLA
jgi:hypothetical protein